MNLAAFLQRGLSYSVAKNMRFVSLDIGNHVSPVLNASDGINRD